MAEDSPLHSKVLAAVKPLFPDKEFNVWTSAEGDLDGDGIKDIAVVITASPENGSREERLVVLTGNPDKNYSILAISGEFCGVQKFYNLNMDKNSLYVEGVSGVDHNAYSSFTLQFRYNAALKDLELIGKTELNEEYGKSYYKVSVNYLNKTIIHSRKEKNRYKEAKIQMNNPKLFRLQGFDCLTSESMESHHYIDEKFSVKK